MDKRYPAGFISSFYDPLKTPNAPTIGTATAASPTSVTITFTPPGNVGGSAITSFIATARRTSDGVLFSNSGASSPITITGLTEVAFTVTVVAVNSFGPGPASAASNSVTPAIAPGGAMGGGFFVGQISTAGNGIADFNLIIGPLSTAEFIGQWKTSFSSTAGTLSNIDGPANTTAMIAAGAAAHPCGDFCNNLVTGGFSDWYMPAKNELEVCYFNLKPTTTANTTSSGINPNAVPARASNYTAGNPAQTSAADFKAFTGLESFSSAFYWSSTESSAFQAAAQSFYYGTQSAVIKLSYRSVRAIRRVPV